MSNKILLVPLLTDMLAVPYLEAAAMENWGLITFKRALLSHSNKSGESTKLTSALVIAHEIAHQVLHTVNCTKIKSKELERVLLVYSCTAYRFKFPSQKVLCTHNCMKE